MWNIPFYYQVINYTKICSFITYIICIIIKILNLFKLKCKCKKKTPSMFYTCVILKHMQTLCNKQNDNKYT